MYSSESVSYRFMGWHQPALCWGQAFESMTTPSGTLWQNGFEPGLEDCDLKTANFTSRPKGQIFSIPLLKSVIHTCPPFQWLSRLGPKRTNGSKAIFPPSMFLYNPIKRKWTNVALFFLSLDLHLVSYVVPNGSGQVESQIWAFLLLYCRGG